MTRFRPLIVVLCVIWAVEAVNLVLGHGLASWGIEPRSLSGLIGIPLAPFIHGSLWHAVSNTLPLIVLGGLVSAGGRGRFGQAPVLLVVLSAALVWSFARSASPLRARGLWSG